MDLFKYLPAYIITVQCLVYSSFIVMCESLQQMSVLCLVECHQKTFVYCIQ